MWSKKNLSSVAPETEPVIITRSIVDFQSVKSHFDTNNLSYYSFYPKSENPMKAVIRHLPQNIIAEDISDGLGSLGFDVISVKQMTAIRRSPPEGSKITILPLFLITLGGRRNPKKCSDCQASAT
jgi:hypothetical protein